MILYDSSTKADISSCKSPNPSAAATPEGEREKEIHVKFMAYSF
jgi:hypothetical protein